MKRLVLVIIALSIVLTSFAAFAQSSPRGPIIQKGPASQQFLAPLPSQSEKGAKHLLAAFEQSAKREGFYRKLIHTGIVILIGFLIMFIVIRIVNRSVKDVKSKYFVRKNAIYFVNILIVLFIIFIWAQHVNSLTIFLGVASAGVALALQEVLLSAAGWFLILIRHPYVVGDRVELGGVKGDVIDIRMFQTSLLEIDNWIGADQSTGRIANVPNSAIFKKESYNYSRGFEFIWNEIKVNVTFESNWQKAKDLMKDRAIVVAQGMEDVVKRRISEMTQKYMIFYDKLTPIVYTNIIDSGVQLSLRYLCEAKKRRSTQDQLTREILEDFGKEQDIDFAYTTYRITK